MQASGIEGTGSNKSKKSIFNSYQFFGKKFNPTSKEGRWVKYDRSNKIFKQMS